MGSSPESPPRAVSPEFLAVFRAHADADATMPFARFMELALYHPHVGYYRRNRKRVGYAAGTDFFTASTSGPVFGELVAAAAAKLLRAAGREPAAHTFVEIGAEPEGGVLAGVAHPFAAARTLSAGGEIEISGDCVVFSNELLDAQPFSPAVFRGGQWHDVDIRLEGCELAEFLRPKLLPPCEGAEPLPDGYRFDAPEAAADLARRIAAQPWRGLFVALDYGKTLRELLLHTPQGTARANFRHTQSNDLLARPGEQDLTCHVCWDWVESALRDGGFGRIALESQEAFFIRHAGDYLAPAIAADAQAASPRKRSLAQLLHPSHLGQKFQALHAVR